MIFIELLSYICWIVCFPLGLISLKEDMFNVNETSWLNKAYMKVTLLKHDWSFYPVTGMLFRTKDVWHMFHRLWVNTSFATVKMCQSVTRWSVFDTTPAVRAWHPSLDILCLLSVLLFSFLSFWFVSFIFLYNIDLHSLVGSWTLVQFCILHNQHTPDMKRQIETVCLHFQTSFWSMCSCLYRSAV